MEHHLGLATRTQISVCKSPFPSTGTAVSLFRAKTVQQRPQRPTSSYASIDFSCQLVANLATTASWMSVVAMVGSGCIGQLSCLTIFSTNLSVAAFLRRAGGSMLESTGSHGRGVERRVPEMRRMVEFRRSLVTLDRWSLTAGTVQWENNPSLQKWS